nr:hypothetical protein [Bacteroidota bacterium]
MKSDIPTVYIPRISRFDITRIFRLTWYFYKYNADIIVSSLHIANVYSWLAKMFYFRKSHYIAQVRSKESTMSGLVKLLNICAFNTASLIITNSKLLNPYVEKYFKQNIKKIIAINNGIEIKESINLKKDLSVINIGTIGKDTPEKNLDLFIVLALKLIVNHKNIHFHLCG